MGVNIVLYSGKPQNETLFTQEASANKNRMPLTQKARLHYLQKYRKTE